jgi:hypothetical protein
MYREAEKQTDTQLNVQTKGQTRRWADWRTDRQVGTERGRETDRKADTQMDGQTYGRTDWRTDRQIGRDRETGT